MCRHHAASGSPLLAPEEITTSPTTSDSRPCTSCPADLIRSHRWIARPPPVLPDSSLPLGTPPRLPTSRSQTTSPATSTGPSTPPGECPVGQTPTVTSDPAPSPHPPLQGLQHYYGPVRRHAPRRYSAPHGVRRLECSLSHPHRDAVSWHVFPRSAQEQQIRITSPPCRTPPGQ